MNKMMYINTERQTPLQRICHLNR